MRKGWARLVASYAVVAAVATVGIGSDGASAVQTQESRIEWRIRSLWGESKGSGGSRPASVRVDEQGRYYIVVHCNPRWEAVRWTRLADGRLKVDGRSPGSRAVVRDMASRPYLYQPILERMLGKALAERRWWEAEKLVAFLAEVLDTPAARASVARYCIELESSLAAWSLELRQDGGVEQESAAGNPPPSVVSFPDAAYSWKEWAGIQEEIWRYLARWRWRGRRVRQVALRTVAGSPPFSAGFEPVQSLTGFSSGKRLRSRQRAILYLALSYLGTIDVDVESVQREIREACSRPESALGQMMMWSDSDGCLKNQVARTLILLDGTGDGL